MTAGASTQHAIRRDVEGLRAIAVGLVLLYHAQLPWFGGGFLGVDVFFVLSGFLITSSLLREVDLTGTIRLAPFYARRARRLLPAASLVLLATATAVRLLLPSTTWRDFGGDIASAAAYVVNWRLAWRSVDYLAEDVVASPVQHFWSLAIEEQFYVVWPALLLVAAMVARRRGWTPRVVLRNALVLVVVVPSLVWSVVETSGNQAVAFFDTGTRMWELGLGGVVALLGERRRITGAPATAVKALSVLTIVVAGVVLRETAPWPGITAAVAVVPTAVLLRLGGTSTPDEPRDVVDRVLGLAPMQRVGAWSYSLYLWHWPPLALLAARWGGLSVRQAVLIVALASIPAVASYHLLENPLRYLPAFKRSTSLTLSVGGNLSLVGVAAGLVVVLAVPASAGGALALPPQEGAVDAGPVQAADDPPTDPAATDPAVTPTVPEGPVGAAALGEDPTTWTDEALLATLAQLTSVSPSPTAAVDDLPRVYEDRCHAAPDATELVTCTYGDPDAAVHVALVGDSKAGQWGDTLEAVGVEQGWRLTYLLKSTCELTTALPDRGGEPDEACRAWGQQVVAALTADPPDLVLTSQVSGTAFVEDGQDARAAEVEGMLDAYRQLEDAGSTVVLLLDNHNPGMNVYECVADNLARLDACTFPQDRGTPARPTQLAVAEAGGFATVDLADHICPTATCLPVIGNVLVYRQGSHVSATYARTLVPALRAQLVPLVDAAG